MSSLAQTNTNVKLNGNATSTGDFIGTTNNENLVIKTNGQNHTIFQKDGDLKVVGLQGAINRLLYTNASGVIKPLAEGTAGQVLLGDLTWGTMPVSYWNINANGNKLFTTINKVGINTNNPAFNLDVNGDGHFSGNLVLNGELIINEKITSPKQLTTAKVVADSIMMGEGKALYGETTIKGDVKLKYRLDVTGDAVFNGNQEIYGNQSVQGGQFLQGSQDVNGTLTARQGLLFASGKGIKETVLGNGTAVYTYGKGSGGGADPVLPTLPCFNPVTYPSAFVDHQMPGIVQIYPADASGNYIGGGSVLNMQSWETVSSIDVAGGNGLLIDYFCGKDVAICTGENATSSNARGGVVRMGHNVMIGGPWPADNYDIALNVNGVEQTGLFVKSAHTTNQYNYGIVSSVNGLNNKAYAVLLQNGSNDKEVISLRGNGEAFFGTSNTTIKPTLYLSPSVNASNQYVTGRVGIGTDAPATALDVKGDMIIDSEIGDPITSNKVALNIKANGTSALVVKNTNNEYLINSYTNGEIIFGKSQSQPPLYILGAIDPVGTGRVGMGTSSPMAALEIMNNPSTITTLKLSNNVSTQNPNMLEITDGPDVNFRVKATGFVYARGIKITIGNFPDYVFQKNYKRLSLPDLENYIEKNMHLPNVPSADEISKEGANVGELLKLNFEKTEEIVLYLIELEKRLAKIEKENIELKKINLQLREQ